MKPNPQLEAGTNAEAGFKPFGGHPPIGFERLARDGAAHASDREDTGRSSTLGRFFVPLTPFCRRSDADLLRSAIDTLQAMTEVPADYVEIKVASGWISLSGTVDWPWQRQAVVNAMRRLVGVAGVGDGIEVRSDVSVNAAS